MDCDLDLGEADGEPIIGYEQRFGVCGQQIACDECERPIMLISGQVVTATTGLSGAPGELSNTPWNLRRKRKRPIAAPT